MDPRGRVALVTGAAKGIGLSCCKELLKKGCSVVMFDINAIEGEAARKQLVDELGTNRVIYIRGDVTKEDQFEAAFKWAIDTFKRVDIVINNAGIIDEAKVDKAVSVNLSSVVRGTLLAMKYMGKDNGGNGGIVINMSSVLGVKPYAGCPVYCATKYALLGLTRSFGEPYYFEKTGIRMVALCPGTTATDMIHCYAAQEMFQKLGQLVENLPKQLSQCVATAVLELIAKASTGTVWVVENGDEVYEIEQPDYSSCRKSPHAI